MAYAIVARLIAQIIAVIHGSLHLPEWFDSAIVVLLLVGFPLAILFTWAFELTPAGIKPSKTVNPADTALRLSRFFGSSDRFWMNLQTRYDLEVEKDRWGSRLEDEVESLREAS